MAWTIDWRGRASETIWQQDSNFKQYSLFLNAYQDLTGRGCLRRLRFHATPPSFLMWINLCDLVYQQPTRTYRSLTAFGHVTTMFTHRTPGATPC